MCKKQTNTYVCIYLCAHVHSCLHTQAFLVHVFLLKLDKIITIIYFSFSICVIFPPLLPPSLLLHLPLLFFPFRSTSLFFPFYPPSLLVSLFLPWKTHPGFPWETNPVGNVAGKADYLSEQHDFWRKFTHT